VRNASDTDVLSSGSASSGPFYSAKSHISSHEGGDSRKGSPNPSPKTSLQGENTSKPSGLNFTEAMEKIKIRQEQEQLSLDGREMLDLVKVG